MKEKKEQISVVIPLYNAREHVPELFECLKEQNFDRSSVEYIFVDNCSTDGTENVLRGAAEKLVLSGWKARAVKEYNIKSPSAARNRGIKASSGEMIAFTDADCRPGPGWLEALVRPFSDPSTGISAGKITQRESSSVIARYTRYKGILSQKDTLEHRFMPYAQTANLAVRRKVLEQIGLFRPYVKYGEDADLCWRMQKETAYKLVFAEDARVEHLARNSFRELYKQFCGYGVGEVVFNKLYGVPFSKTLDVNYCVYRFARWIFKDLPMAIANKGENRGWFITPLDLIALYARQRGQAANLCEDITRIDRLESGSPE